MENFGASAHELRAKFSMNYGRAKIHNLAQGRERGPSLVMGKAKTDHAKQFIIFR